MCASPMCSHSAFASLFALLQMTNVLSQVVTQRLQLGGSTQSSPSHSRVIVTDADDDADMAQGGEGQMYLDIAGTARGNVSGPGFLSQSQMQMGMLQQMHQQQQQQHRLIAAGRQSRVMSAPPAGGFLSAASLPSVPLSHPAEASSNQQWGPVQQFMMQLGAEQLLRQVMQPRQPQP